MSQGTGFPYSQMQERTDKLSASSTLIENDGETGKRMKGERQGMITWTCLHAFIERIRERDREVKGAAGMWCLLKCCSCR